MRIFSVLLLSRNLGCFSIDPTITIAYTTKAKMGMVTMNQSNSVLMIGIVYRLDHKSRLVGEDLSFPRFAIVVVIRIRTYKVICP